METQSFLEIYENNESIEIHKEICEFYSQPIKEEDILEYDLDEILDNIVEQYIYKKKFEELIDLIKILKDSNPEYHYEIRERVAELLLNYFCNTNNVEKIKDELEYLESNLNYENEIYASAIDCLNLYGYNDLIENSTSKVFSSSDLKCLDIEFCEYVDYFNFFVELEKLYDDGNDRKAIAESRIQAEVEYENIFTPSNIEVMMISLQNESIVETIQSDDNEDFENMNYDLQIQFSKYMKSKKLNFNQSSKLFHEVTQFWEEVNYDNDLENYSDQFIFSFDDLDSYFIDLISDFIDDEINFLFGLYYVYEFLYSIELINEEDYQITIELLNELKEQIFETKEFDLWRCNYIFNWEKPDAISNEEYALDKERFGKSITLEQEEPNEDYDEIVDELFERISNKDFSLDKKMIEKRLNLESQNPDADYEELVNDFFKGMFLGDREDDDDVIDVDYEEDEPKGFVQAKVEKKIGRNEPCPCGSGKKYKKCCIE
jgi:hypothetical protein